MLSYIKKMKNKTTDIVNSLNQGVSVVPSIVCHRPGEGLLPLKKNR